MKTKKKLDAWEVSGILARFSTGIILVCVLSFNCKGNYLNKVILSLIILLMFAILGFQWIDEYKNLNKVKKWNPIT